MRVVGVVVTWNRKELLLECLAAIARQTHPLERVIVVDNASTDGTMEALEEFALGAPVRLDVVRLTRNGGGSEGFHYGVLEALTDDSDWVWLMDDDCEPADDALERLLASNAAADPGTSAIAPVVRDEQGRRLPMHRGRTLSRWFRAPVQGPTDEDYAQAEVELDFFSFVGPLFRTRAARAMGAPAREYFVRFEDLEYSSRAAEQGRMWVITGATVVHKENVPLLGLDLKSMWRNFSRRGSFAGQWMGVYGLRNTINSGRRHGYVTATAAATYVLVHAVRILLFEEQKLRTTYLYALYAYDGWRGLFRNLPPPRFGGLAEQSDILGYLNREALRYDEDVSQPVRTLTTRRDPRAPATPAA